MRAHINSEITIRRMDLAGEDRAAVSHLSQLDSSETLQGPVLGLEVEGSLLAAVSLTTGETIADPFSRTAELRTLLEVRAQQVRRRSEQRRGLRGGRPATAAPRSADRRRARSSRCRAGARAQCCSSGASVRPASSSCCQ